MGGYAGQVDGVSDSDEEDSEEQGPVFSLSEKRRQAPRGQAVSEREDEVNDPRNPRGDELRLVVSSDSEISSESDFEERFVYQILRREYQGDQEGYVVKTEVGEDWVPTSSVPRGLRGF